MKMQQDAIDLFGSRLFTRIRAETPIKAVLKLPPTACFIYILDGDNQFLSKTMQIKGAKGQVILSLCGVTAGHVIANHNGEAGEIQAIVVHFDQQVLTKIYEISKPPNWVELENPNSKYLIQESASALINQYILGIVHFFNHKVVLTEEMLVLKLKEIILLLLQCEQSDQMAIVIRSLFSERVFSFKEIIEAHLFEPMTVANLAALTNHSLTTFKREFKKIYNTSPKAYIANKRIERLAQMLAYSDEPINRLGYACGFTSSAHVSRIFKKKYGISPSAYRSKHIS